MPDVFTKQKRSEVMARIRGKGNKETELALMKILRRNKITGWRRHQSIQFRVANFELRMGERKEVRSQRSESRRERIKKSVRKVGAATVDFVFPKERVVVLVDGCFWHGCPKHSNMPRNNRLFWEKKLTGNKKRDRLVNRTLKKMGWKVVRIWEHELRDETRCVLKIHRALGLATD